MAKKKTHKLDIFNVLNQISTKKRNYYEGLSEEEQKAFMPLVVMRWLSGTRNARQVFYLNELVNPSVFSLHKHKKFLYYLMTICTTGHGQRYFWNKTLSKRSSTTPVTTQTICQFFGYNTREAADALPLLSDEDILSYAEDLGKQPDEIRKIKKELKGREQAGTRT